MKACTPPRGVFQGSNFMTPNWLGYYKLRLGYAELSEGRGMSNQPIFGVTVRTGDGLDTERRSKLFQSRSDAEDYIEELS
jgi:hypothetical protein